MFVQGVQVQIRRSRQRTALGDLHRAAYCYPWARDGGGDEEAGLEAHCQKIVVSAGWKRYCLRRPCDHLSEKPGDGIAKVERSLLVLICSPSFLLMDVLNLSHCHSLSRLSRSAAVVSFEMLP